MYGHVEKLAQEIEKGASSVEGVEAKLFQVWVASMFSIIQKWKH
jgi:multimeric flavodoxin WrbA